MPDDNLFSYPLGGKISRWRVHISISLFVRAAHSSSLGAGLLPFRFFSFCEGSLLGSTSESRSERRFGSRAMRIGTLKMWHLR